jgi:hypothetical protein
MTIMRRGKELGMMTHDELVARAGRWLRNTKGCRPVFMEITTSANEIPDAIGWRLGHSVLVECKTCLSDFYADQRKNGRRNGHPEGIGFWRYYLTEPGLLAKSTLPDGWGWLEFNGRSVHVARECVPNERVAWSEEIRILLSLLRRIELRVGDLQNFTSWPPDAGNSGRAESVVTVT